jgi:ferredoxin
LINNISLFKIRIDNKKCGSCGLCEMNCKAKCIDAKKKKIDISRCVNCFNCIKKCHNNALSFSRKNISKSLSKTSENLTPQAERRSFIIKFSTIAAASILLPKTLFSQSNNNNSEKQINILDNISDIRKPITPPGSLGYDNFNKRCSACHLCVSKCPTKILTPAKMEYGFRGIMQPTMKFANGYCEIDCNICYKVCPNGAILDVDEYNNKKQIQIGVAKFHSTKCQVNSMNINCGICAEHCPTNAIALIPSNSNNHNIPLIDENKCIGCGACEYMCPTDGTEKAI